MAGTRSGCNSCFPRTPRHAEDHRSIHGRARHEALLTIDETIARLARHGELFVPELYRIRGEVLEKTADQRGAEAA
jgi:hypothetical protein